MACMSNVWLASKYVLYWNGEKYLRVQYDYKEGFVIIIIILYNWPWRYDHLQMLE